MSFIARFASFYELSYEGSRVAKKIKIRKMPELIFIQDTSLEQGNKIENILKEIEK